MRIVLALIIFTLLVSLGFCLTDDQSEPFPVQTIEGHLK